MSPPSGSVKQRSVETVVAPPLQLEGQRHPAAAARRRYAIPMQLCVLSAGAGVQAATVVHSVTFGISETKEVVGAGSQAAATLCCSRPRQLDSVAADHLDLTWCNLFR